MVHVGRSPLTTAGHRRYSCVLATAAILLALAAPALALTRVHSLVIANNQPYGAAARGLTESVSLAPLRHADDDAVAFYEFLLPVVEGAELLTIMDRDTQALYPDLVARTRVPSIAGLRAAVTRLVASIEK